MPKQLIGIVTSDKGNKTIVITVRARKTHPVYKKQYTVNTKFIAHDENNEAQSDDLVSVIETRPLSAGKRFILNKILKRGGEAFTEADALAGVEQELVAKAKPAKEEKSSPDARSPAGLLDNEEEK